MTCDVVSAVIFVMGFLLVGSVRTKKEDGD